ncbi:Arc family DNA-binding protein [Mesorhizobium denitrificans]|uniref:Arc family DNA-binding protein n=1 Tax=Mesorhizobium denitrificans TaxID=2294114 RepID=A0A371XFI0_9HYPH|nr:Arc family DNA-binding protein [Mesorhizobium denitrificans]RFC67978.1 Arc family DNA-binding protein [Mesorhizobium denitrificans]
MKPDEEARLTFRYPASLRDLLTEEAEANNRSLGAEIVHRLQMSFVKAVDRAMGIDDRLTLAIERLAAAVEKTNERS